MSRLAKIMIVLVALLHLYIAWFGIFAWQGQGPATFPDLPASLFEPTTAILGYRAGAGWPRDNWTVADLVAPRKEALIFQFVE